MLGIKLLLLGGTISYFDKSIWKEELLYNIGVFTKTIMAMKAKAKNTGGQTNINKYRMSTYI